MYLGGDHRWVPLYQVVHVSQGSVIAISGAPGRGELIPSLTFGIWLIKRT